MERRFEISGQVAACGGETSSEGFRHLIKVLACSRPTPQHPLQSFSAIAGNAPELIAPLNFDEVAHAHAGVMPWSWMWFHPDGLNFAGPQNGRERLSQTNLIRQSRLILVLLAKKTMAPAPEF